MYYTAYCDILLWFQGARDGLQTDDVDEDNSYIARNGEI